MTIRRPLQWHPSANGVAVDGLVPLCEACGDRLSDPLFVESVRVVAVEHGGNAAGLAKRFIDAFHANRHREDA